MDQSFMLIFIQKTCTFLICDKHILQSIYKIFNKLLKITDIIIDYKLAVD